MPKFKGQIFQDSTYLETEWEFIFKGHCLSCFREVGQLLRLCKKDWGTVLPCEEEINQGMMAALRKNHDCPRSLVVPVFH